jgi:hypothetical protein
MERLGRTGNTQSLIRPQTLVAFRRINMTLSNCPLDSRFVSFAAEGILPMSIYRGKSENLLQMVKPMQELRLLW